MGRDSGRKGKVGRGEKEGKKDAQKVLSFRVAILEVKICLCLGGSLGVPLT